MADKEPELRSWWQTVPGILTGLAAIITAITGLVIAFHRAEPHDPGKAALETRGGMAEPGTASTGSPQTDAASRPPASAGNSSKPLNLPAGMEVKLAGGDTVIKILSAQLEAFNSEKRGLRFVLRHTNRSRYPANFWSDSYRLIVDDVPRAPTNLLDEVVAGDSAKEGEVLFEVPATVSDVVLQIRSGDEKSRVPFHLTASQP